VENPRDEFGSRSREILCIIIDTVFLCIWALVQAAGGYAVQKVGFDQWLRWPFRIVFGISTLAVVVIWMYRDVRIMWIRATVRIRNEELHSNPGRRKAQ